MVACSFPRVNGNPLSIPENSFILHHITAKSMKKSLYCRYRAVNLANSLGDNEWLGKSYRSLGLCYSDRGDHDSSKLCLDKALTFIPNNAMTYYFLGENEWLNGDYPTCTSSSCSGNY